jgi:NRAMP (natural resistance-associated macrophage protein)-like metal ion transporter
MKHQCAAFPDWQAKPAEARVQAACTRRHSIAKASALFPLHAFTQAITCPSGAFCRKSDPPVERPQHDPKMKREAPASPPKESVLDQLGPGLITGAADDDPSGIATYSQAGAQFGLGMLWTVVLTFPMMVGIQMVSARIGRVTGQGLAANIRRLYPAPLLWTIVGLLLVANTVNIAADLAAMGEVLQLVAGGGEHGHALVFGLLCVTLQVFIPYERYVRVLKWLTLTLLAYVAVVFTVRVPWIEVLQRSVLPGFDLDGNSFSVIVAVFGTTISPYLFFWQASQECEEMRRDSNVAALRENAEVARRHLRRIKIDTYLGMGFSNLIAFFIMLSAALTLNVAGVTEIHTASEAAQALRPVAGNLAFLLFGFGIIGTGLLAVPVLAGSAAYATAEAFGWKEGLDRKWFEAKEFYAMIALATLGGALFDFTPIDPFKALLWSAALNGIIAVPIMALMMQMAVRRDVMGPFIVKRWLRVLGWMATVAMAAAVVAMFTTL